MDASGFDENRETNGIFGAVQEGLQSRLPEGIDVLNRRIRVCFCIAVAAIAAAIADPIVEAASNAGWFGPGTFTDRSNLDVLPVLFGGCALAAIYLAVRVRGIVTQTDPIRPFVRASNVALGSRVGSLLPLIFVLQLLVLYSMETAEQAIVWGHTLGGTIWLGGPVLVSLAVHAVACVGVVFGTARAIRVLAVKAAEVIRLIQALTMLSLAGAAPIVLRRRSALAFHRFAPALCSAGERAPPLQ